MKKNDLIVEEAKKRFQQITEYVVSQGSRQVLEADDETEEPQGDMGGDPNAMGGEPMQPDDEVIDVDELTDSQEETEKEVAKINSKFDKVIKAIGAFEELLRSNDEKIDNLRDEFEKRNPSKIEKLQMQTANSYPFNQRPEDYWKEKEATSNYQVVDDDILFNQTLNKILGL